MSGLAIVSLVLIVIWLGILTLLLVLVIRQVGIVTARFSMIGAGESFDIDADGPEIGSEIPSEVKKMLPGIELTPANFVLLSATCNPCRELATNLNRHHFGIPVITLLAGRKELADGLASMLPSDIRVLRDPEASQIAAAFQIQSTPFAVTVVEGKVRRKSYLHSIDDLMTLVNEENLAATLWEGENNDR